jgi:hypothetical protein
MDIAGLFKSPRTISAGLHPGKLTGGRLARAK